jgi:hypothetical protein
VSGAGSAVAPRRSALEGTLADLSLGELFGFLAAGRRSGVIELRGVTAGVVALHDGRLTIALSESGPTLQQVFVGSGLTTTDGWWEATAAAQRGAGLADAVIDAGADPADVERVLREQTIGAVFELLLPSRDPFVFTPGATHPIGHRFTFEPDPVLAEAGRRVSVWKRIAEAIPSTAMVMVPVRRLPTTSVTITEADWTVLALLDGRRSIADIIRELGMSAFAVCSVLHDLREAKLVEPRPDADGRERSST